LSHEKEHRGAPNRIAKLVSEENVDEAIRHAHSIRAVAGNLGADTLQEAAKALELLMTRNPGFLPAVEFSVFEIHLKQTCDGIGDANISLETDEAN